MQKRDLDRIKDKPRWPDEGTLSAICDQTHKFCGIIRDLLPTTARRLSFAPNALTVVRGELDRLMYLFYGRTPEDYDSDKAKTVALGWLGSLASWIVATPGPSDWPRLDEELSKEPVVLFCHNLYPGWGTAVQMHGESLIAGLATLRVYFGQSVFKRSEWIPAGEWLRERIQQFAAVHDPQPGLGNWFD